MTRLPHWNKAYTGAHVGLALLTMVDHTLATLTDDEYERMKTAHARLLVALATLNNFSTRDYAYDRGGEQISDAYLDEYRYAIWTNDGTT